MQDWRTLIEEKDYCDESHLILSEYAHLPHAELTAELQYLQRWLHDTSESPLVVAGEEASGKKTLLAAFLRSIKKSHVGWLHIAHFGSMTPIYSHILYRTMVALRNHFRIEQRVDLNEEKLRRYFKYWLEVTSQCIDKQYLGYAREEIPKVLIVIEGIDQCLDLKGHHVAPEFWLPATVPRNVKLILSTRTLAPALLPHPLLRHHLSHDQRQRILRSYHPQVQQIYANSPDLSLYALRLLNSMMTIRPNFSPSTLRLDAIFTEYITNVSGSQGSCSSEEVRSLLYVLTLTRKGLRASWLQKIVSVGADKWDAFLRDFGFLVVEEAGYFLICSKWARKQLAKVVDFGGEKQKTYRLSIARCIRNQSLRLRGLEEAVYQLLLSESYSELKEIISRVENFAMLYTPLSKDLLCQCWVRLEQLEQYDPVFEYNRAVEAYTSHYYPKEEDLYRILFQLCMFFKEYSEFENARTPQFRHPLIRGEIDQLQEIGILEQLKSLAMVGKCKSYKLKPLEKMAPLQKKQIAKKDNSKKPISKETEKEIVKPPKSQKLKKREKTDVEKPESESSEGSRPSTSENNDHVPAVEVTLVIEQLNVSIISNQQKFRQFFTNSMKEYLQNYFTPLKKSSTKEKQLSFQSDESQNEDQSQVRDKGDKQLRIDVQKIKDSLILKKFKEYLEENYHKSGEQVSCYYYKQWIWLQFPWICQTVKHVYSNMIKECLPGSIHFMSPLRQFTLIKEVLKIARNAKQSKLGIFTEKKIEILPLKHSSSKLQMLKHSKYAKQEGLNNTVCITKRSYIDEEAVNRYKINLNKIDDQIQKEKELELRFKERSQEFKILKAQASAPNMNLFVTETFDKDSRMLPLLNKSKFINGIPTRRKEKENHQDSRDFTQLIRKYNEVKHDNDILIQKIEEMRKVSMMDVDRSRQEYAELGNQISELEAKKQILERNFIAQEELKKKLEVIIKICDLNKMYGSESDYLSTYLTSLKQMISIEQEKIKEITQKITIFVQESKNSIRELRQKRKTLKLSKEQVQPYLNCATDSTNQQIVTLPIQEIEEDLRQMAKSTRMKSKKQKTRRQFFFSSKDYQQLQTQLDIHFGDNSNQQKIQFFIDRIQKRKELQLKNNDLSKEADQRQRKLSTLAAQLKALKEGKMNQRALITASQLIEKKKELQQIKQRNQLLTHAIDTLEKFSQVEA